MTSKELRALSKAKDRQIMRDYGTTVHGIRQVKEACEKLMQAKRALHEGRRLVAKKLESEVSNTVVELR